MYNSNYSQLNSEIKILESQLVQKEKESYETSSKIAHLKQSYNLILEEKNVMEPLIKKGIVSKVEYLKLLREINEIKEELESTKINLSRVNSSVNEYKNRISSAKDEFKNKAAKEYNEVLAKIDLLGKENNGYADQVKRTSIKAPVDGYIKTMHINTIGGSVKPGMDLIEIVPNNENLIIETKIKPEDIAFLYEGQKATIKFSAYDFTIYGALVAQIEKISPDSITDEKGEKTYYLAYLKTENDFLGTKNNKLKIKPGMRGSADIITGEKTILEYLLKPIIKTKNYALSEH